MPIVLLLSCRHRLVLEVTYHRYENTPTLYVLTNSQESVAFTICNLYRLKASTHLLYLILHLCQIHLSPFQLEILIKANVAFLNVLPEFLHPSNLNFNCINNLCASVGLTFGELEHFLVVNVFIKLYFLIIDYFFELLNTFETILNPSNIAVETLSFKSTLKFL
jgi:hypothetical protein